MTKLVYEGERRRETAMENVIPLRALKVPEGEAWTHMLGFGGY